MLMPMLLLSRKNNNQLLLLHCYLTVMLLLVERSLRSLSVLSYQPVSHPLQFPQPHTQNVCDCCMVGQISRQFSLL